MGKLEATQLQKCSREMCSKLFPGIMIHPFVFTAGCKNCSRRSGQFCNLKHKWISSEMNIPAKNILKILCCKETCYGLVFVNLVYYFFKINKFLPMHHNLNCSSTDVYFQLHLVTNKQFYHCVKLGNWGWNRLCTFQ